jgi:hypothetical protein
MILMASVIHVGYGYSPAIIGIFVMTKLLEIYSTIVDLY